MTSFKPNWFSQPIQLCLRKTTPWSIFSYVRRLAELSCWSTCTRWSMSEMEQSLVKWGEIFHIRLIVGQIFHHSKRRWLRLWTPSAFNVHDLTFDMLTCDRFVHLYPVSSSLAQTFRLSDSFKTWYDRYIVVSCPGKNWSDVLILFLTVQWILEQNSEDFGSQSPHVRGISENIQDPKHQSFFEW